MKSNTSTNTDRRRLLKKLVLVGGTAAILPEQWVKPVIQSVTIPAHAQSTFRP